MASINERDPARDITSDEMYQQRDHWQNRDDENSTLDERTSAERSQDVEEVRGLLRKVSSSGKRRPSREPPVPTPSVPALAEPGQIYGSPVAATSYPSVPQPQGRPLLTSPSAHPQPLTAYPISPVTPSNNPYQAANNNNNNNPYNRNNPPRRPGPGEPEAVRSPRDDYTPYEGA